MRRALLATLVALLAVPAGALAVGGAPHLDACGDQVPLAATLELSPLAPVGGEGETHACWGKIQPGGRMTRPVGCTMSFIFADETGALYISTAGHCIGASGSDGRVVEMWGVGRVGVSVYNINAGPGRDFGLVKIDPEVYHLVDPTLCHWGGPSEMGEFTPGTSPRDLLQYGFGFLTSATSASRARVHATHGSSAASFPVDGVISSGDSGSPVMFGDGGAAGIVTHGAANVVVGVVGIGTAQRLDAGLAMAEAHTGRTFTLVTSDVPVRFPLGT